MKISDLPGLGPKSEKQLSLIGIDTTAQLKELGAIRAFIKLKKHPEIKPSLNFLYALVGALEGRHWLSVAKNEKARLLFELDGYQELEKILAAEGIKLDS